MPSGVDTRETMGEVDLSPSEEIEPYLEEYFFDRPEKVDNFRWERVRTRLGI